MSIYRLMIVCVLTIGFLCSNAITGGQLGPESYGIGATITRADSLSPIMIRSCFSGGPAEQAGLLPGDQILKLDSHSIEGWSLKEVLDYLIHDKPALLTITVLRDSSEVSFELLRAKYSDIAAGVDMKLVRSKDSLSWQFVPLEELPPLEIGSLLIPVELQNIRCKNAELRLKGVQKSILYFWASWCGPCKLLMRELVASKEKINISGVRVIGINVDRSCETFIAAIDSLKPPGEQYWAGGYHSPLSQVLRVYKRGIPTAALVDQNGQLVKISTGVYKVMDLFSSEPIEGQ
jgi:thiol-disulfide isomerase/thioredoxin